MNTSNLKLSNRQMEVVQNFESVSKKKVNGGSKIASPQSLRKEQNVNTADNIAYPSSSTYKRYDQITHVYNKTDMYTGSDVKVEREEWLYDVENDKMYLSTIDFVPTCEKIYMEILSNASDNVGRSRRAGVDPGKIEISVNRSTVSIKNYGLPIPIELTDEKDMYVPQMIFGELLTSSNYDNERLDAGTNGIGAKATNIFSNEFMVIIESHTRHLKYTQVWNNNMRTCGEPTIEKFKGKHSSVQVVYNMDFARFNYPIPNGDDGGYPDEVFNLFARHAVDVSFTAKTKVIFNGKEFDFQNIKDYARLYFGDAVDTAVIHYQWPEGTEIVKKTGGFQTAKQKDVTPDVELIAIDTPDAGSHVSFVNCAMTKDGGVHVNASIKAVGEKTVQMINDSVMKKLVRINKGKEIDAKEKRSHTISINDVKPHISILLSVKVANPKFSSQTKTQLQSPTPKIEVTDAELRAISKWKLNDRLYAALNAKQFNKASKTDGKLSKYVRTTKGVDANFAGKAQRLKCTLYATEGDSGAGYADKLIALMPGGRDFSGVYPMRGKGLNVMNASELRVDANKEITELKKMLGLKERLDPALKDTWYLDDANFSKLRYGSLMIMADSDLDGKHIIGLLLNFFHCRFPSLLARGYVKFYRTPIMRVKRGKNTLSFYSQKEYDEWTKVNQNYSSWEHKYFKGLGTSTDSQIADDYKNCRMVTCVYDDNAASSMVLAFNKAKEMRQKRKEWMKEWKETEEDTSDKQPISTFINHELILFSMANVQRAIPKLMDGFKESHRKVIHGAHLKFNIGPLDKEYKELKIAQFGAFIAEKVNYHHGERILDDVIVGLAQDFTLSNNISLFTKDGQLGTRFAGGKDASESRYTFTRPAKLFSYIFRREDQPILKSIIDEGEPVEPETFYPIIPLILVNGAHGIGTGYSTFIPNHNPLDIINWLKLKLQGVDDKHLPKLVPWYRGFTGKIEIVEKTGDDIRVVSSTNADTEPNSEITELPDSDEEDNQFADNKDNDKNPDSNADPTVVEHRHGNVPTYSMISEGNYHIDKRGHVVITELPVGGKWPAVYNKWLEELLEKKLINYKYNQSIGDKVYFEIGGLDPQHISTTTLKLKRPLSLSNMVVLNKEGKPVRYNNATEIMKDYFKERLQVYVARKDFDIGNIQLEINELNEKLNFIKAIIDKNLLIINRPKAEIYENIQKLGLSKEIFDTDKVKLRNCTQDEVNKIVEKINFKQQLRTQLINTRPEDIWLRELKELEVAYRAEYKLAKPGVSLSIKKK